MEVGIESYRGKLRQDCLGVSGYISTGLADTPENRKKPQKQAWEIEEDIAARTYTKDKYVSSVKHAKVVITDIGVLWGMYCEYIEPQIEKTTYLYEYINRIGKHIPSL
jgi:hypothetical protein